MIYVRIELHPGGDKSKAELLSEATMENTSNLAPLSNYRCLFSKRGGFKWNKNFNIPSGNVLRDVMVEKFPRKRLYAHDLLLRALVEAFGDRNLPKQEQEYIYYVPQERNPDLGPEPYNWSELHPDVNPVVNTG